MKEVEILTTAAPILKAARTPTIPPKISRVHQNQSGPHAAAAAITSKRMTPPQAPVKAPIKVTAIFMDFLTINPAMTPSVSERKKHHQKNYSVSFSVNRSETWKQNTITAIVVIPIIA